MLIRNPLRSRWLSLRPVPKSLFPLSLVSPLPEIYFRNPETFELCGLFRQASMLLTRSCHPSFSFSVDFFPAFCFNAFRNSPTSPTYAIEHLRCSSSCCQFQNTQILFGPNFPSPFSGCPLPSAAFLQGLITPPFLLLDP